MRSSVPSGASSPRDTVPPTAADIDAQRAALAKLQTAASKVTLSATLDVLEAVTRDFIEQARRTPLFHNYLADERGFADPAGLITRHRLGYASGHGLVERLRKQQVVPADLLEPALVQADVLKIKEAEGKLPKVGETFWKRLMFPIAWDVRDSKNVKRLDATVGFGGRVFGDGDPKYLNSRATPVFQKKQMMYGLPRARAAIQELRRVQIVEGNLDTIRMQENGFANTVAGLGTAIGVEQFAALAECCGVDIFGIEWVFCLDADTAGEKALVRALDAAWCAGLRTSVAVIDGGKDADKAILDHGPGVVHAALAHRTTGSRPGLAKRSMKEDGYGRLRDVIKAMRTLTIRGNDWAPTSRAAVVTDFAQDLTNHGFTPSVDILTALSTATPKADAAAGGTAV